MALPLMFGTKQVHIFLIFFDSFVLQFICYLHRVKYGLDQFLDHFFYTLFWDHFEGGITSLLLREGWNEVYRY